MRIRKKVAVLCFFESINDDGELVRDALMIHVTSSKYIVDAFAAALDERAGEYVRFLTVGPRPRRGTPLLEYLPAHGRRVF